MDIAKNIVTCFSPGRSGTELLAHLLELAENTTSFHEPDPTYQQVTESTRKHYTETEAFVRHVKLPSILSYPYENYVETSHLFAKGPFEAFINLKIPFRMIILNRDPRQVAKSHWRINAVPARSRKKQQFLLHPESPNVMKLPHWQSMTNYQLCYWYCLEIERRKPIYMEMCRANGLPVAEIHLNDLLDFDRFNLMCDELDLRLPAGAKQTHEKITSVRVNKKSKYLPNIPLVPLPKQERQVWDALGPETAELFQSVAKRYDWDIETFPW